MAESSEIAAVPNLEAEADGFDDGDSALGNSIGSSTTSIGSSILKHRLENGRTYHAYKDGKYHLPNDEGENARLDLQHHLYLITYDGKLSLLPEDTLKKFHRVLDVGTGTGIWAIDYADEHPETKVLGVDLSPIQPTFIPPNVSFEIDDVDENWTFSDKFDLIHSRMMTGSISNWPRFFQQAFEFTEPGGFIEISDCAFPCTSPDGTLTTTSALLKWSELILDGSRKIGRSLNSVKTYEAELKRVGYTEVSVNQTVWPMNRWPKDKKFKEMGMWNCENMTSGLSGFTMALGTRVYGWTPQEVEAYIVDVKREMEDMRIHAYWPIYTITAKRPL